MSSLPVFVGLDYHQNSVQVCVVNGEGKVLENRSVANDASLIDREGWNTLVIRAVGNRHVIFLNGQKVADVRDDTSERGRIGFQVHAGDAFATMKVLVREASIRPL